MKIAALLSLVLLTFGSVCLRAESFDARAALGITAGSSVDAAVKRGKKENKRVLVFALDETKIQGFHIQGMLEFEETKKLVKENFLLVVTDFKDKHIRDQIGSMGTERPMYFLFDTDGKIIQKGSTAMGGSAGAKLVKEWTSK